MGSLSPWHWLIVILVFVLLFGSKRLPDAARSLGKSMRIFKSEVKELQGEAKSDTKSDTKAETPQAAAPRPHRQPSASASSAASAQPTLRYVERESTAFRRGRS